MPTPKTPTPDGREKRVSLAPLELRAAADDAGAPATATATGYAALFNTWSDIAGLWREKIAPGAFTRSLAERDVVALHSHDLGRVVGRTGAGTLTLREDATGLAFENELPDTSDGRDLAVQIKRRDIPGMSFGFVTTRQEWNEAVEPPERTILEADLYEITYTASPAYADTTVGLRSLDGARLERSQHNRTGASQRIAARRARQAQLERRI